MLNKNHGMTCFSVELGKADKKKQKTMLFVQKSCCSDINFTGLEGVCDIGHKVYTHAHAHTHAHTETQTNKHRHTHKGV